MTIPVTTPRAEFNLKTDWEKGLADAKSDGVSSDLKGHTMTPQEAGRTVLVHLTNLYTKYADDARSNKDQASAQTWDKAAQIGRDLSMNTKETEKIGNFFLANIEKHFYADYYKVASIKNAIQSGHADIKGRLDDDPTPSDVKATGATPAPVATGATPAPVATGATPAPVATGATPAPAATGATPAPVATGATPSASSKPKTPLAQAEDNLANKTNEYNKALKAITDEEEMSAKSVKALKDKIKEEKATQVGLKSAVGTADSNLNKFKAGVASTSEGYADRKAALEAKLAQAKTAQEQSQAKIDKMVARFKTAIYSALGGHNPDATLSQNQKKDLESANISAKNANKALGQARDNRAGAEDQVRQDVREYFTKWHDNGDPEDAQYALDLLQDNKPELFDPKNPRGTILAVRNFLSDPNAQDLKADKHLVVPMAGRLAKWGLMKPEQAEKSIATQTQNIVQEKAAEQDRAQQAMFWQYLQQSMEESHKMLMRFLGGGGFGSSLTRLYNPAMSGGFASPTVM